MQLYYYLKDYRGLIGTDHVNYRGLVRGDWYCQNFFRIVHFDISRGRFAFTFPYSHCIWCCGQVYFGGGLWFATELLYKDWRLYPPFIGVFTMWFLSTVVLCNLYVLSFFISTFEMVGELFSLIPLTISFDTHIIDELLLFPLVVVLLRRFSVGIFKYRYYIWYWLQVNFGGGCNLLQIYSLIFGKCNLPSLISSPCHSIPLY